jgi:Family of unknown function (DUF6348)
MEPATLENELSDLMKAHDVPFHVENEWIVPFSKLPAIRATWYPRESSGLLEVNVLLEDERIINECFAGIGSGSEGIRDALQNFCVNSFHVLLASLWSLDDPDQVMTEHWNLAGKKYTAYIGNFGTRGSNEVDAQIPQGLFETIEKAIKSESLNNDLSWFRCFFCDVSGEQTFEALKNNEVWESGVEALKSLLWVKTNGYYSVRNFLVLRKNA